ncbi:MULTISPECIES: adenylate kinase [Proteiniphilum]|jgi:adenylate kinase|uniref:adenylate kinase n=1 Tax=Proteiniphilum TaxID=294702 RepID=UPI001EEC5192|nr:MULTISPECIES: adenylate kinase [Proteiniphilum]MDD2246840.1 adenylate kinase [Proteiniphilum sp.]MDD3908436.1 adenylate kinase [Proteiniphilum sp.]MDD4415644.1 adenylate kinase [Proteiniphilum sp.]ULB35660.1 adenylate kinase [Proteiniphilum propionicum]
MLNIVIFGAPGSGKGTQSARLVEKYGLKHVSTGEILRSEIRAGSQLGQLAESYMSKGELVPDDVVIDILEELIERNGKIKGFIFDGFPRTLTQGEALSKMLMKHDEDVNVVISLDVEDEELIDRLLKRGQISGRKDDNRKTIESRLRVYYNQTSPLKDFYKEQGILRVIRGTGTVDEIFNAIEDEIDQLVV